MSVPPVAKRWHQSSVTWHAWRHSSCFSEAPVSGTVRNCPGLLCHLREPWHRTSLVCINQPVADRGLGQWSLIYPLKALITVSCCIHQRAAQGLKHQPNSAPARPCTAPVRQLSMLLGRRKLLHCRGTDMLWFSCAPKGYFIFSLHLFIWACDTHTHPHIIAQVWRPVLSIVRQGLMGSIFTHRTTLLAPRDHSYFYSTTGLNLPN